MEPVQEHAANAYEENPYGPPRREYEFDEHENEVFRNLSEAMKTVGTTMLILGPLRVIFGGVAAYRGDYANGVSQIVEGICFFLIGNWTGDASGSYLRIVSTKGADITHLMASMVDLKKIFSLQRTVMLVALAAITLGLIAGGISWLMPGSKGPEKPAMEEKAEAPPKPAPVAAPAPVAPPAAAAAAPAAKPAAPPAPPVVVPPPAAPAAAAAPAEEAAAKGGKKHGGKKHKH